MRIVIDTDTATLHERAGALKDRENIQDDLANDPHEVLAHMGIEVDPETAERIRNHANQKRLASANAAGAQSAIVHVDVG